MAEYRLSRRAERDLLQIYAYTNETFGRYQAEAYLSGLDRSFGLLADFPLMGASAEELAADLRRFRFQSHFIFYTQEADFIVIRTILHISMNLRPSLFE